MRTSRYLAKRPVLSACLAAGALLGSTLANLSAQIATWNGGTGNRSNVALWSNGAPSSASFDVYIDGGQTGAALLAGSGLLGLVLRRRARG